MAIEDSTLVGLRDQILGKIFLILTRPSNSADAKPGNWRYLHPHRSTPVIIIAREEEDYEAILAEDRAEGTAIFLASSNDHDNIVEALEELLDLTAQMISKFLRRRSYGNGRFYAI
jgi:hypothetical protein